MKDLLNFYCSISVWISMRKIGNNGIIIVLFHLVVITTLRSLMYNVIRKLKERKGNGINIKVLGAPTTKNVPFYR